MRICDELGVQSFCFRAFKDNAITAAKVKEIGMSRIELCAVHANFTLESTFSEVIETYRNAGVEIVAIGPEEFRDDPEREERLFVFAQQAGAKLISASFDPKTAPGCFRTAEKLADKYDINLGIHNHGGRDWLGSAQMLDAVFAQTSPRIGLMLDTAWALASGEDPVEMCERFGNRLYGLHIKDFTFDRAGEPTDVVVGTGNLDLKKLATVLKTVDFSGLAILEYEGDKDNPVPALIACAEAVRRNCNV